MHSGHTRTWGLPCARAQLCRAHRASSARLALAPAGGACVQVRVQVRV